MRTIKAPGIQVNEIDKSNTNNFLNNSYNENVVLIPGFAAKGDDYDPKYIFSKADFLETYGTPTTLAEKYFYNAAKEVFNTGNIIIGAKLPYDNNALNKFTYTSYKVDDECTKLYSPIDIIKKNYNGKNLSSLLFLEDINEPVLSSVFNELSFIKDFATWLSSCAAIDYSLSSTFNSLFYNIDCFNNLSNLLYNNFNDINMYDNDYIYYITNFDLKTAIGTSIPDSLEELNTSNKTRDAFYDFAKSFENLINFSTSDDLSNSNISSDNNEKIDENIIKILNKLKFAGFTNYNDTKNQFLKTISLKDVKTYYDNFLAILNNENGENIEILEIILNYLPEKELIEKDFELPFTSIKQTFSNIKTAKFIKASKTSFNNLKNGYIDVDMLDTFLVGNTSTLEDNEIIIVDKSRQQYNRDYTLVESTDFNLADGKFGTNQYLGIVPIITTAAGALYFQQLLDSDDSFAPYNLISKLEIINSTDSRNIPLSSIGSNFSIPLSGDSSDVETLGSIATSYFPQITWKNENEIDNTYLNQIGVVVCKMAIDPSSKRVVFNPVESFIGSLTKNDFENSDNFIDDIINSSSNYIYFFSNIINKNKNPDIYIVSNQPITSLGFFESDCEKNISVSKSIFEGLDLIFNKLSDTNLIQINLLVDAGMSDICQFIGTSCPNETGKYDPINNASGSYIQINSNSLMYWKNVIRKYQNFCENIRKDCMFICDAPRALCLDGNLSIIRKTRPKNTIENSILNKIKYLTGIQTSYGAGYCNWVSIIDDITYTMIWIPGTIKVIASYLNFDPWMAPAGVNRGKISNTYNLSFNPTIKDAEKIYENNWNYMVSYPLDGIVIEGQKTFQTNSSAFNRINIRRTFLYLENNIRNFSRDLIYENITFRMLSIFSDKLNNFLMNARNLNIINDFYVICDDRNNNEETIDKNEVHVSIGIKPVKTLEFIILSFICTTQSANVQEATEN